MDDVRQLAQCGLDARSEAAVDELRQQSVNKASLDTHWGKGIDGRSLNTDRQHLYRSL